MALLFPTAPDTNDSLIRTSDNARTTLSSSLTSGSTSISVASTTTFPATGTLVIDSEIILYTSKTSNSFGGLTRGVDGTSAASHTAGVAVRSPILSLHKRTLDDAIIALQTKVGYGASTPVANAIFGGTGTGTSDWITSPTFNGANITALNASNLASGTIPDARFPATLPAASGVNLTALNASNLASGTLPDARFPATLPASSGVNLTALNASNLGSGTVPAARLDLSSFGLVDGSGSAGAYSVFTDSNTVANGFLKQTLSGSPGIMWIDGIGSSVKLEMYSNGTRGIGDTTFGVLYADANVVTLTAEGEGGFGAQSTAIRLNALNGGELQFYNNNAASWRIPSSGHLLPDGTRNIGASGTRVNEIWANQVNAPVAINNQTGTTYTLQASDMGKRVTASNGDPITVTIPAALGVGFHCEVMQAGIGSIQFVGSGGASVVYLSSKSDATGGPYSVVHIMIVNSTDISLSGDLAVP